MITQRNHIDYQPHSRPKKYYIIESQLRSGVYPDTHDNRFHVGDFKRYPKTSVLTAVVWIGVMIGCAWGIYQLLFG